MRNLRLLLLFFAFFAQAAVSENLDHLDTLSVSGQGFVDVKPDVIDLHVELYASKITLAEAKQAVDDLYQNAQKVLEQFEVKDTDIKLERLQSFPEYEWRQKKKVYQGHRVSRRLKVSVRNIDSYPELLDSLVKADITEISHVVARVSNDTEFKQLALKKAVADAKKKAKFLATEFDRELGKVLIVNESGSIPYNPVIQRPQISKGFAELAVSSSAAAPPQESFGTQRIQASINAVFTLQ